MGVRTQTTVVLEVGQDNSLDVCAAKGDISELVDTLDHVASFNGQLAASEANTPLPFGDVAAGKIIYLEADAAIDVTLGGTTATSGTVDGAGGTYPTTLSGGDALELAVDGTDVSVTLDVADQLLPAVINRINAAAALLGIPFIAFDNGGELRLQSPTSGDSSTMEVKASGVGVLAALGLTESTGTGLNPDPNTSQLELRPLADPAGTQIDTLKAYALLTVSATAVYLTNPSTTAAVNYKFIVVGDFVS